MALIPVLGNASSAINVSTVKLGAQEFRIWHDRNPSSFALPNVSGSEVSLEAQRGRIVLLHFFATWCAPCKEELPALSRFASRATPRRIQVLAISVAEVPLRVKRFLEEAPVTFPVLLDEERVVAKAWKVSTLPSTIILDADLKPRLVAEPDFAWDQIEPPALIEILEAKPASSFVSPPAAQPGKTQP